MQRIDFVKRHQSHGCYEKLVHLGKMAYAEGRAASVTEGVEAACHANPALTELVLDGPQDPKWTYMPVIKDAMGYVDREALQAAHINTAYRLNPSFARQVGRGDFLAPASAFVEKAAPDPLPTGTTATEALTRAAQQLVQKGMAPAEAQHQATAEHPTWYATYLHESRGR